MPTGNAPVCKKWEENRWVTESLGYSEFLYRFCLSGTSLLIYYELERYRLNRSPEVGEYAPPPRSTTARAIRMKI
jgi:hypothetical protein